MNYYYGDNKKMLNKSYYKLYKNLQRWKKCTILKYFFKAFYFIEGNIEYEPEYEEFIL